MTTEEKIELVRRHIRNYPDFPKPGILFRDIFSVLKNAEASRALNDLLLAHSAKYIPPVQAVCSLDARGFLLGPLIASHFCIPFVPIRKKGKLPGCTRSVCYNLEYGSETFEIQIDALQPVTNVMIVDDLMATGGSLAAACELISAVGSKVNHCLVVIELEDLQGRKNVPAPVHSLIKM